MNRRLLLPEPWTNLDPGLIKQGSQSTWLGKAETRPLRFMTSSFGYYLIMNQRTLGRQSGAKVPLTIVIESPKQVTMQEARR